MFCGYTEVGKAGKVGFTKLIPLFRLLRLSLKGSLVKGPSLKRVLFRETQVQFPASVFLHHVTHFRYVSQSIGICVLVDVLVYSLVFQIRLAPLVMQFALHPGTHASPGSAGKKATYIYASAESVL